MVELQPSKLAMRVRFPSPARYKHAGQRHYWPRRRQRRPTTVPGASAGVAMANFDLPPAGHRGDDVRRSPREGLRRQRRLMNVVPVRVRCGQGVGETVRSATTFLMNACSGRCCDWDELPRGVAETAIVRDRQYPQLCVDYIGSDPRGVRIEDRPAVSQGPRRARPDARRLRTAQGPARPVPPPRAARSGELRDQLSPRPLDYESISELFGRVGATVDEPALQEQRGARRAKEDP